MSMETRHVPVPVAVYAVRAWAGAYARYGGVRAAAGPRGGHHPTPRPKVGLVACGGVPAYCGPG
eukprot:445883-Prymnesium_polylepis.2